MEGAERMMGVYRASMAAKTFSYGRTGQKTVKRKMAAAQGCGGHLTGAVACAPCGKKAVQSALGYSA